VKEVVEVLVGNRIARVGPGFHVSPPGVDHSPHIRVVSAVDSTQSAVDEIDIVLLSHRAALVGTAPYDVFVDVGAQSGSLILVSDGGVRLGLGTIASCERNDATRALTRSSSDAAGLAPDVRSTFNLGHAVKALEHITR
jgi:hypothetical protein